MKHAFIAFLGSCLLLSACVTEETPSAHRITDIIDGLPVTVMLPFSSGTPVVYTKAGGDDTVSDLFVLVFSEEGRFEQSAYFSVKNGNLDTNTRQVRLTATSGRKKVFAVANVTSSNFNSSGQSLKAELDAFCTGTNKTLADWKQKSVAMTGQYVDWSPTELLMSGRFSATKPVSSDHTFAGDSGDGACLFHTDGKVYQADGAALTDGCKIWLTRTVSHITFNIRAGINKETGQQVVFEPESWIVHNLPRSVSFNEDGNGATSDVFNPDPAGFDGKIDGNTFNFFMLENRQPNGTGLDTDSREGLRSDNSFKGAYIVLKGKYRGMETNPFFPEGSPKQQAVADVTYYIHLGFIDEYGGANDLSVYRNHKYVYNVTVTGVNSIIVEAFVDDSETERADGDVVFAEAEIIETDAHYARKLLTFQAGNQLVNASGKMHCTVKTARTGGEVNVSETDDIDWVWFVEKSVADALWADGGKGPDFTFTDHLRSQHIYNIRQLASMFEAGGAYYDIEGTVQFYAYIKENYYDDNTPLSDFINFDSTTGTQKSRTMKIALQSANKSGTSSVSSARFMIRQKPIVTIFDMSYRNRNEQVWGLEWINESLPDNYFTSVDLRYKALETGIPYKRNTDPFGGFGTPSSPYASSSDGRINQLKEINPLLNQAGSWKILLDGIADIDNADKTEHASAYAACMSRNRDENGDGVISDDEIKWYLPAIDQYQHFWIGTNAVPEEATLYPADFRLRNSNNTDPDLIREMFTYVSSGGHRFFADEAFGVRIGDWNQHARNHIRCARNIGSGARVEVAKVTDGAGSKVYDIRGFLTRSSLRDPQKSDNTLPSHNEYSEWNRLPAKLEVKKVSIKSDEMKSDALPNGGVYVELLKYVHDGKGLHNPCNKFNTGGETGWRIPNERELILFTTLGNLGGEILFTQTFSSMWNYDNWTRSARREENGVIGPASRYGYLYNVTELHLPFNDNFNNNNISWADRFKSNIRCVRDIE